MKKKNQSSIHKSIPDQLIASTSLFASKQSKQRVLEQLKRGTLFRWSRRKETEENHILSKTIFEEPKSWLFDIKLGIQNQQDLQVKQSQGEYKKKKVDKLPNISRFKALPYRDKAVIEKRCDKITCLTKKLSRLGAWKEQNSKNIENNISRLERSLNLEEKSLIQDDFWKVQGLNTTQDKSLQSSLIFLDKSSILQNTSGFNPFQKFPNFSQTLGQQQKQKKKKKQNQVKIFVSQPQQNTFIPRFLMNSIILYSPKADALR